MLAPGTLLGLLAAGSDCTLGWWPVRQDWGLRPKTLGVDLPDDLLRDASAS